MGSSKVLQTRQSHDGYRVTRRHLCINGHKFTSIQQPATKSIGNERRLSIAIAAARRTAVMEERYALIRERLAEGELGRSIADDLRISESLVSLVKRGKV